ncbi:hypothetical protein, variant [Saprolegnia diclina VS20]|uniref:EF-hand domain-containing protein n=1 Tax=Saprolegnia diclina (strain VS20) TaxID=1156394 RepID=T0R271_SAPDV|nr:hypothetical protein, variant [Saprolegnia diclina VS20]EQC26118.1 hypothetical protein, variant [Saprolegnia diclina VS20]|eukprot:XP_008620485.1 hypothetical protein, variant [Saprolegnia diclina VS20]
MRFAAVGIPRNGGVKMHGRQQPSPKKPRAPGLRRTTTASNSTSPRAVAKPAPDTLRRDNNQERTGGMEPFKVNPILEATQPNKYRRKRTDLKPLAGGAVHPIIQTSLEADRLDQRLSSIKLQIDHVLLGGHLAEEPSPCKPIVDTRPMTTEPSPVSFKSTLLPSANAPGREILQAQRYLCADAEVEHWLQTYEAEKGQFTSFALFTEYKLDQLTNFTAEAGRPNVIETAACFAALYKMPGILGSYKSLLQKIVIGLEYSIYGSSHFGAKMDGLHFHMAQASEAAPSAIGDVVRSFYQRKPFFVQLRELEHDQALTSHLGLPRRTTVRNLTDADKVRVLEVCSADLIERGLQRFPDDIRKALGRKLAGQSRHEPSDASSSTPSQICRQILALAKVLDTDTKGIVVAGLLDELSLVERTEAILNTLGPEGEALVLANILGRDEAQLARIRDSLVFVADPMCLVHMYFCSSPGCRAGFLEVALGARHEYDFLNDLMSALSPDQRRQLAEATTPRPVSATMLTPRRLHEALTALAASPTPFAPLEQKALFHDVCKLLQTWTTSEHINLEHFVIDAVYSSIVSRDGKLRLLKTLLKGDGAKTIVADYLGSLSLADRLALDAHSLFLLEPFKKHVAGMTNEMRLNVLFATMEAIAKDLEAHGVDLETAKPVKSIQRYVRELFGLAVSAGGNPAAPRPSVHPAAPAAVLSSATVQAAVVPAVAPTAPPIEAAPTSSTSAPHTPPHLVEVGQTVATTLEVLRQLEPEARATILQSLAASMPEVAPNGPRSLEMQLVSGLSAEDVAQLLQRAMRRASTSTFEAVVSNVVATYNATGRAELLDDIVEGAFGAMPPTESTAPNARHKLLALREISDRRVSSTPSTSRGLRRFSDSTLHERALRSLPEGTASVACQTDDDGAALPATASGNGGGDDDDEPVQVRKAPLTVIALLKKSKNKKKLDRSVVPNAFASLVTSWKINSDQLAQYCKKPLGVVLKLISDVYAEKLYRRKRETKPLKANSLARICYQTLLHAYGLPSIADMHLIALGVALDQYRSDCLRVDAFCKFVYHEVPAAELRHYLNCLETLLEMDVDDDAPKKGRVSRLPVPDRADWDIPLERAMDAATHCLASMRPAAIAAFLEKLLRGKSPRADVGDEVVAADVFLDLVVAEWRDEQSRREAHLRDAFRAGDNNGDGVLSFAEFQRIVLSIDKRLDDADVLLLFSETLRRTGSDSIDAETFLSVAKENGLDEKAWMADDDLGATVNSLADLNMVVLCRKILCFQWL